MIMLPDLFTLSTPTLHTLIRWQRGEPHPVLSGEPVWHGDDVLHELDRAARAELAELGQYTAAGLDPRMADAVGALIRPDREFYGWVGSTMDGRQRSYTVLAVTRSRESVLAVRDLDRNLVALAGVRASELLDEFLAQLPPNRPARGRPLSVPKSQVDLITGAAEPPSFVGFPGMAAPDPAERKLRMILDQPRTGFGFLYAAARPGAGVRRRCAHPVSYFDTPEGRWATDIASHNGEPAATLAPADRQLLATRLHESARDLSSPFRVRRGPRA